MKTKKALAVILAVVMLVMPLAVSSLAADTGIIAGPAKAVYNDSEYFSPFGIVISYDGEEIAYTPGESNFRFFPELNELVTVDTNEIMVYYNNEEIVEIDSERYVVYRTYSRKDDYIELMLRKKVGEADERNS